MDYLSLGIGIIIGIILGAALIMFYIRWKMKKQLGMMEEQMGDIMDMTESMGEEIPEPEGFEEADKEEAPDEEEKKDE